MQKRILVAEDDPSLQDIFKVILEKAGYMLEIITNGNKLLQNQYVMPDLFLLDKHLSGFDGLDVCKHLKQQKRTSKIPVIMISANPNISKMSKEAGADDYIEKPFDKNYLLGMIEKYILKKGDS